VNRCWISFACNMTYSLHWWLVSASGWRCGAGASW